MISRLTSIFLITTAVLSISAQAQDISLFNGRDLSGWAGLPGYWSVKDGAITGRVTAKNKGTGNTFLVWQGGEVGDFELTLKFKLKEENAEKMANSGIQFRASLSNPARYGLHGYQAELDPGTYHPDIWPPMASICGCLAEDGPGILLAAVGQKVRSGAGEAVRRQAPIFPLGSLGTENSAAASYKKNDWNECRIVAVVNHIEIFINGLQTVDSTDDAGRFSRGLIGLQLHGMNKEKTLQFKDIKLRVIKGSGPIPAPVASAGNPSATGAAAVIQTDVNQPRIEVLKDQGLNAVEWALAPLDQPAPGDIRKNLAYLREDLLDESKQKPKGSAAAYALGSQLCEKILAALDERAQASVRAGYTAAQADADVRVTSSQLEVRRNYMMSWPQYAREKDQRAEITRQQLSAADLKKERTKVEWSARSQVLHKYLDDLYRQFRGALR